MLRITEIQRMGYYLSQDMYVCVYVYMYIHVATPSPNGSFEAALGKNSKFYSILFAKLKLNNFFVSFQFSEGMQCFNLSFLFSCFPCFCPALILN